MATGLTRLRTAQNDVKFYPFKTIEKFSKPHFHVDASQGPKTFGPMEISAMILTKMKKTAEASIRKKVASTNGDTHLGGEEFEWRVV